MGSAVFTTKDVRSGPVGTLRGSPVQPVAAPQRSSGPDPGGCCCRDRQPPRQSPATGPPGRGWRWICPCPRSPMIITPPMRGSTTLRSRASFTSSCPTMAVKGRMGRRVSLTGLWRYGKSEFFHNTPSRAFQQGMFFRFGFLLIYTCCAESSLHE